MKVYAEWINEDGTYEGHVFSSWTAINNFLPPVGIHAFKVEEISAGKSCTVPEKDAGNEKEEQP